MIAIDASFCLFPGKENGTTSMTECIWKYICYKRIRKERFFLR